MSRIADTFQLPLRAATTVEGDLVLSDAADEDVLLIPRDTWGPAHRLRLQELAEAFNALADAGPTPVEEAAIRRFTEADYRRRLLDSYAGHALAGLLAEGDYGGFESLANEANAAAQALFDQRYPEEPSDAGA